MATFAKRRGAVDYGVNFVEYLQSSGVQHIDAGYKPNQNTRVVVDFEMSGGANEVLYGARVSSSSDGICFFKRSAGYFCSQYNDTLLNTNVAHDTNRHTVDANRNVTYLDGSAAATFTAGTFIAPCTLVLFASNDNGTVKYYASARIYSCQIYDNDVLVRNLWPCYDPDGVPCMFDKVTKTYFYNQGSGEFGTPDAEPDVGVEVGTTWAYTADGTFEVPADGNYQVELHGGGGGGAIQNFYSVYSLAAGGGSGELIELFLSKGAVFPISIGEGGVGVAELGSDYTPKIGAQGGSTSFGDVVVSGGGGGHIDVAAEVRTPGEASGSIASSGGADFGSYSNRLAVSGGYGNKNNTAQTYGNGGNCVMDYWGNNMSAGNGQPGAVIITYLGA